MTSALEPVPDRRRARALGVAAQVAGVAGLVICLLLALGVLWGRAWATDRVDEVASAIDARLARGAVSLLETASTRVAETSARLSAVADSAGAVAADSDPGPAALQALQGDVMSLSERYLALRTSYAEARATIVAALDRLDTIGRLVPGLSIPSAPAEALAALDARVQALDAQVMELMDADPLAGPIAQAAEAIAEVAGRIDAILADLSTRIDAAIEQLDRLRGDVAATAGGINTSITTVAIAIVLVLLYVALLHAVLFRAGRELRPRADAA